MTEVDEEIRRNFESDWLRGQCGDIVDYLPMPEAPSYLPTLEELICIDLEFRWQRITKSSRGIDSSSETLSLEQQPLVEKYLDRFPQLHDPAILQRLVDQEIDVRKASPFPPQPTEYQQRFPQLQLPGSSFPNANGLPADETRRYSTLPTKSDVEALPSAFGAYQLMELLGRGGMGKVYRAHQAKADRMVAIKIAGFSGAPPEIRDEIAQRFESEVRAAANLAHDNVMPIYDVGEVDGSLYYTMPIVAGDLASEVRKNPLTNNVAARYLAQAARGVAAAHHQGLLHRDIKPHNLMLDPDNERVLVADFGLARLMSAEEQLTITGEVLGTPPYMAPEQIRSSHAIDVRADVYALGATLYHLLVGKPPIQAATPVETLRQVLEEEPASPRELNPQIDRDLETICLRCLQKEPRLRFASADELADDLERYLRGEPIKSRPIGIVGRLDRWRRRNPKIAALSAGLAASLLLVAIIAGIGWYSTEWQLARVMQNNRQGQLAVNDLYTFIRDEPLLNMPGHEAIRAELLQRGLDHYQQLIDLAGENETLPADLLEARTQLGLLKLEIRDPAEAALQFRQVIDDAKKLPKEIAETRQVLSSVSDSWNGLGQTLHRAGKEADAAAAFDKAIALRTAIVKQAAGELEPVRKLANAKMNHALILAAQGKRDDSQQEQIVAQRDRRQLLRDHDKDAKLLRDYAKGQFNLARLELTTQGVTPKATELLQDATQRFGRLTALYSTDAELWQRYIECLLTMSQLEDFPHSSLQKACDLLPSAMVLAPENREYRIRLITIAQQAIEIQMENRNFDQANELWEKVETKLVQRLGDEDQSIEAVRLRLLSLRQHGLITLGMGDKGLARRHLRAAIQRNRNTKEDPAYAAIWTSAWKNDWEAIERLADSLD
ncbi:serine/threonine-protein kinase [Blastopirellula retiformator]|uniref:non-specific serine/threonine protein kinase n=1 Tax=Blastopirellula retiformator TaxID=2527970 RepID=A0A5C5VMR0_9BACT|nr:serine/threonine-protein kinase [Blastopirellula retiformator]TWT39009.1 Serine/threonine-protein kinase PrkC [Blastopirellula retiformator]